MFLALELSRAWEYFNDLGVTKRITSCKRCETHEHTTDQCDKPDPDMQSETFSDKCRVCSSDHVVNDKVGFIALRIVDSLELDTSILLVPQAPALTSGSDLETSLYRRLALYML